MERRTAVLFVAGMAFFWSFFSYAIFPVGGFNQTLVDRSSVMARSLLLALFGGALCLSGHWLIARERRIRLLKGTVALTGIVMLVFAFDPATAETSSWDIVIDSVSASNIALLAFCWAWASDQLAPTRLGSLGAASVFFAVCATLIAKVANEAFSLPEAPTSALFPVLSSLLVLGIPPAKDVQHQTVPSLTHLLDGNLSVMLFTLVSYDIGCSFFRKVYTQGVPAYESINASAVSWLLSFVMGIAVCACLYRMSQSGPTHVAWISLAVACLVALYCIALFGKVMPQLCNDLVISTRFFAIVATAAVLVAIARSQHISSVGLVTGVFLPLTALTRLIIYGPWQIPGTPGEGAAEFLYLAGILAPALLLTLIVFSHAVRQMGLRGTNGPLAPDAQAEQDALSTEANAAIEQSMQQAFGLTRREGEVLALLSRGYSQKKIAETLVLSVSSVQSYSKTLYRKLGVHSKQEVIDLVDELRAAGEEEAFSRLRKP